MTRKGVLWGASVPVPRGAIVPTPSLALREACPSSGPGQSAKTLCAHMDRARLEARV